MLELHKILLAGHSCDLIGFALQLQLHMELAALLSVCEGFSVELKWLSSIYLGDSKESHSQMLIFLS